MLVRKPELLLKLPENPKILILRQDRIGDVLISVPVLKVLKKHFPQAEIDVLLGKNNFGARNAFKNYAHDFFLYDKKLLSTISLLLKLRFKKYDAIIDLQDKFSRTSSLLIKLLKPKYSIGIPPENLELYTHSVEALDRQKFHIVERTAQVLLPFGIDVLKEDLQLEYDFANEDIARAKELLKKNAGNPSVLRTSPLEKGDNLLLGINLAGSSETRYWGTENFIEFLKVFKNDFSQITPLIFATPDYEKQVKEITLKTGVEIAPQSTNFHGFAALLHECDLIFTPDTSVVHLAAAWQKPAIALFSNAEKTSHGIPWTPYGSPHIALETDNTFLSQISVKDVILAFKKLLAEHF
ncbi:MAG: glycosyltransferase family 9 protein [Bacteroidota bacterium]